MMNSTKDLLAHVSVIDLRRHLVKSFLCLINTRYEKVQKLIFSSLIFPGLIEVDPNPPVCQTVYLYNNKNTQDCVSVFLVKLFTFPYDPNRCGFFFGGG